jgi:pteridine reductase
MAGELAGRTAVVTGGAVRLGRAIVKRLAERGARVMIHYGSSSDEAGALLRELATAGAEARAVSADLSDPVSAAQVIFDAVREEFGSADILINSAAIFERGSLLKTTEEAWDRHQAINLKSPFFLAQTFVRQLPVERRGAIVNVVDWRGTHPIPGHAAYTIAKAGLAAMTQLLAQELGDWVRVNGVAPGAILPPPGASRAEFERLGESIPVRHVGSPEQICDAVEFLVMNSFVNGEIIHVTGGQELVTGGLERAWSQRKDGG